MLGLVGLGMFGFHGMLGCGLGYGQLVVVVGAGADQYGVVAYAMDGGWMGFLSSDVGVFGDLGCVFDLVDLVWASPGAERGRSVDSSHLGAAESGYRVQFLPFCPD
jgi:hypothetical protein